MVRLRELEEEIRTIPYPGLPHPDREARRAYRSAINEKVAEYKKVCLNAHGIADHPKADAIWDFAWEEGHSAGLQEVDGWVIRLAELVKG